jgi:tryptophan synthase alpha chain
MNPVDACFATLRASGRKAFIPFLPAGDPDLALTREALPVLAQNGASLIEVGFPFSDPIADGPVIQASYTRALGNGLRLSELFATTQAVSQQPGWQTPMVAMASYSLVWRKGPDTFLDQAQSAGLSGAVVPDLPAEEAKEFAARCRDRDFKLILLVTPTTTPHRAEAIVQACGGFVYVVSVIGITGARDRLPPELFPQLERLRGMTDLPLCVGFGVSQPEHVRELVPVCDGVIVGSALVKRLELAGNPAGGRAQALEALGTLCRELSGALG